MKNNPIIQLYSIVYCAMTQQAARYSRDHDFLTAEEKETAISQLAPVLVIQFLTPLLNNNPDIRAEFESDVINQYIEQRSTLLSNINSFELLDLARVQSCYVLFFLIKLKNNILKDKEKPEELEQFAKLLFTNDKRCKNVSRGLHYKCMSLIIVILIHLQKNSPEKYKQYQKILIDLYNQVSYKPITLTSIDHEVSLYKKIKKEEIEGGIPALTSIPALLTNGWLYDEQYNNLNNIITQIQMLWPDKNNHDRVYLISRLLNRMNGLLEAKQGQYPAAILCHLSSFISPTQPAFKKLFASVSNLYGLTFDESKVSSDIKGCLNEILLKSIESNKMPTEPLFYLSKGCVNSHAFRKDILLASLHGIITNRDTKPIPDEQARIPILLNLVISDLPIEKQNHVIEKYKSFETMYHKINNSVRNPEQHQRDFKTFVFKNLPIICMLVTIMKEDAFVFLKKYLAATSLSLERMLADMKMLPHNLIIHLAEYYDKNRAEIISESGYRIWEVILTRAGVQIDTMNIAYHWGKNNEEENQKCNDSFRLFLDSYQHFTTLSLADFNEQSAEMFVKSVFKSLELEYHAGDNTNWLMKLANQGLLTGLVAAKELMKIDNYYRAVFNEMLICDLTKASFDDFIHNLNQQSTIGRILAEHNNRIQAALKDGGIDVALALNYPHKLEFSFVPGGQAAESIVNAARTLWLDSLAVLQQVDNALQLLNELKTCDPLLLDLIKKLTSIKKNITALKIEINDLDTSVKLANDNCLSDLNKISNTLRSIINNPKSSEYAVYISKQFQEFADHFQDHLQLLKTAMNEARHLTKDKATLKKPIHFEVRQWDKSDIRTNFLGNYVRCCVATNGPQYQALVQRRMDDAMQFHTVVDKNSDTPVALAWLYFAKDKRDDANTPTGITVIANFLEITSKYGTYSEARDAIINNLLHFTSEYCATIGVKYFIINHLALALPGLAPTPYGLIPDFNQFAQMEFHPEKIGGFLNLTNTTTDTTENQYYLNSLNVTQFHHYPIPKLQIAFTSKQNPVKDEKTYELLSRTGSPIHKKVGQACVVAYFNNMQLRKPIFQ